RQVSLVDGELPVDESEVVVGGGERSHGRSDGVGAARDGTGRCRCGGQAGSSRDSARGQGLAVLEAGIAGREAGIGIAVFTRSEERRGGKVSVVGGGAVGAGRGQR